MIIKNFKNIIVFASHHDDEVIGCGATIRKLTDSGCNVTVVFATSGHTGTDHTKTYEKNIVAQRAAETEKVAKILGIKQIISWGEKTQDLSYCSRLLHKAIILIRKYKPELIITHSQYEKHKDHVILNKIITQATWKASEDIMPTLGKKYRTSNLWAFEVVDVLPKIDFCIDVYEQFKFKLEAMKVYESQKNVMPGKENFL